MDEDIAQSLNFLKELKNGNVFNDDDEDIHTLTFCKSYTLSPEEVCSEINHCIRNYLEQKKCPHFLALFIARTLSEKSREHIQEIDGDASSIFGIIPKELQLLIDKILSETSYELELRKLLASERMLPLRVSAFAIKNKRRKMEDRHVVIHDLNTLLGLEENYPAAHSSYYAVFDGHAGVDAASYAAAHLHVNLAKDPDFFRDPRSAVINAYRQTDIKFFEKATKDGVKSGCTAVTALIRESMLYLAWLGDSQAVLIEKGKPVLIMDPHKPNRQDERMRIESLGGFVHHIGTWRVNGSLAVSRALGDYDFKPYVSSEPEVNVVTLNGTEDFLVLACDGIWDAMTPEEVAAMIYRNLNENSANATTDTLAEKLVHQSKIQGSDDNITILIVFLRSISEILSDSNKSIFLRVDNDEALLPVGESGHCPERPKILENIISFPSLCPKSDEIDSDMLREPGDPTELSELPTPPIDDIQNHFSEYYNQGSTLIELATGQDGKDSHATDGSSAKDSELLIDTSDNMADMLAADSSATSYTPGENPASVAYDSGVDLEVRTESVVSSETESTVAFIHSELNPDAEAFVPRFCSTEISTEVSSSEYKEVHLQESLSAEDNGNAIAVLDEVLQELSIDDSENCENDEKNVVPAENEPDLLLNEPVVHKSDDNLAKIEPDHLLVDANSPCHDFNAHIESSDVPVKQECLSENLIEMSTSPCPEVTEKVVEDLVSVEPNDLAILMEKSSAILEVQQNFDLCEDNIINVVSNVLQHSDASSVEPAVAVDLKAVPDGIPEAEGVCEDIDSDSEKDGGWSFVKPADGILDTKIIQPSDNDPNPMLPQEKEKSKTETIKPGRPNATTKQRLLKVEQPKKTGASSKSPAASTIKRSPLVTKTTASANSTSQVPPPPKTSRTLPLSRASPTVKARATQHSSNVADSSKSVTKGQNPSSTTSKKETTPKATKPAVPTSGREALTKTIPSKSSLASSKAATPSSLQKTDSPVLQKMNRTPIQKSTPSPSAPRLPVTHSLKSKPVVSPAIQKPTNPVKPGLSGTIQKPSVAKKAAPAPKASMTMKVVSKTTTGSGSVETKSTTLKKTLPNARPIVEMKETKNAMNKQLVTKKTNISGGIAGRTTGTGEAKKPMARTSMLKSSSTVTKTKKVVTNVSSTASLSKKTTLERGKEISSEASTKSVPKEANVLSSDLGDKAVDATFAGAENSVKEMKSSSEKYILECNVKESVIEITENHPEKITSNCSSTLENFSVRSEPADAMASENINADQDEN